MKAVGGASEGEHVPGRGSRVSKGWAAEGKPHKCLKWESTFAPKASANLLLHKRTFQDLTLQAQLLQGVGVRSGFHE